MSRLVRRTAGVMAIALALTGLNVPAAAAQPWQPPAAQEAEGVAVADAASQQASRAFSAEHAAVRGQSDVAWPQGTATANLLRPVILGGAAGVRGGRMLVPSTARAGALPVTVGPPGADVEFLPKAPSRTPGAVTVNAHDRQTTAAAGVQGLLLSISRADGERAAALVTVEVDYSGFADAYGGDWASRLQLVHKPACAIVTPQLVACQGGEPVPTTRDPAAQTLTAGVPVSAEPMVLAAQAGPSGENGDYSATSLSPAGTWQVSAQSGDFAWSYPLRMPPSLGGPAPSLGLSYSSGSIDGRTATTNNQGSWLGDGWDMWPGFIERKYKSCADDNPGHKTGDQCWYGQNATLSLNGRAGELIKAADGRWRLVNDDGTRIERLTDTGRGNGDNDNEYWKLVTTDGMQFYFGYHKLPGWSAGKPVTDSVWTVPVFGNNPGEPCHSASGFAGSWCQQAWRWNLDYVLDPHGNAMSYFYGTETGAYARDNTPSQRQTYDRGGWLRRIDYGQRHNTIFSQAAPLRVVFNTAERCLSGCWSGTAWTSEANPSAWPDTPLDQYCKQAPCNEQGSPTFWTMRRLTEVSAQVRDSATGYRQVESWALRQQFLNAGTGESTPMWLRGITRTGHVSTAGGAQVSEPEIEFDPGAEPLPNRVDGPSDGRTELNRWRIKTVRTESGGHIIVTYSGPDCTRTSLPTPHSNTTRCMPAYWSPDSEPVLDWFHKYVVTRVDLDDVATDQPNQSTFYDYLDTPAWHYSTDELTKDQYRTWGQWRGYGRVRVRDGDPSQTQTAAEYRYLRGMHGDKQPTGSRDVQVADSWGGSIEDHEALQGFLLQQITYDGPGGAEISSTLNAPWIDGPTATRSRNGVTTNAFKTNTQTVRQRTALEAGGYRTVKSVTTFNNDGFPLTVTDHGDEAVAGDETCTRTEYARNEATWMIDKVSQSETISLSCAVAQTPAAPETVLSRARVFYDSYVDDSSYGEPPTKGDIVRAQELDSWNGSTPVYVPVAQTAYDDHGRVVSSTDANGATTLTDHQVDAVSGLTTAVSAENALGHVTTTVMEPAWQSPTKVTDPNGAVTELTYDGLGRLTNVWLPGRQTSQTPSMRFAYQVRNNGQPTAITAETLLPTGRHYRKSVDLFDGWLRLRQSQTQAPGGGRTLTDTRYNTAGQTDWTSAAYYDSTNAAVSTTLGIPQGQIPSITELQYDGAGRATAQIFLANGAEKWRTTTTYGGDRTHSIPPVGGTGSTSITDVRGNTVALRQYTDIADVGSSDPQHYDQTGYAYTLLGQMQSVTDAVGNSWSYQYDLRGRQIQADDPDRGVTTSTYDAAGNLQTSTSPLGQGSATLAFTYDALGRKSTVRDDSITGPVRSQWVYDSLPDGLGKLTSATRYADGQPYTTRVDSYDAYGRQRAASLVLPAAEAELCQSAGADPCVYTAKTTYRPNGQINRTTLPGAADMPAETFAHGWNDVGLPSGLLSAGHIYVHSVVYNKLGQLTQRQSGDYGKRVAITSSFDEPTRRLTGMNVVPELKPETANYSYTYDDSGNVTKISEAPQNQAADHQCFSYDYLRRLTAAWTPADESCNEEPSAWAQIGGPAPYWHAWTFDKTGNRSSETRHGPADTTYTYEHSAPGTARPHAVTGVTATGAQSWSRDYSYDNAGNTTSRPNAAGGTQALTFDPEGHLATLTDAQNSTEYLYDTNGTRLIRKDHNGSTLYLPDGTEIRAEGTVATATRYYSFAGQTVAVRTADTTHWIIGDHHGTAEHTINAATLDVAKRRTLPYGQTRSATGAWPADMDKGFIGGTNDPTGLTHLGAREYDPTLGRFISDDPVTDFSDPQQVHGYAYSNNSPATYYDPDGNKYLIRELGGAGGGTVAVAAIPASAFAVAFQVLGGVAGIAAGLWTADELQEELTKQAAGSTGAAASTKVIVDENFEGVKVVDGNGKEVTTDPIANELKKYTEEILEKVKNGDITLDKKQVDAIRRNPRIAHAQLGTLIDKHVKALVEKENAELAKKLFAAGSGLFGPDWVQVRRLRDIAEGDWYDVTTAPQWGAHVNKYGSNFGSGRGIIYKLPLSQVPGLASVVTRSSWGGRHLQ